MRILFINLFVLSCISVAEDLKDDEKPQNIKASSQLFSSDFMMCMKDLNLEEEMFEIIELIDKIGIKALKNSRDMYCQPVNNLRRNQETFMSFEGVNIHFGDIVQNLLSQLSSANPSNNPVEQTTRMAPKDKTDAKQMISMTTEDKTDAKQMISMTTKKGTDPEQMLTTKQEAGAKQILRIITKDETDAKQMLRIAPKYKTKLERSTTIATTMKGYTADYFRWVPASLSNFQSLASKAVVAGKSNVNGSPIWVIRCAYHNNKGSYMVPGTLVTNELKASFSKNGKEYLADKFEVLTAPKEAYYWKPWSVEEIKSRGIPHGALVASWGNLEPTPYAYYIGRVPVDDMETAHRFYVGSISSDSMHFGFRGKQIYKETFDILVRKNIK